MANKIAWKPFPKQARFLSCPAMEVFFGGAASPGKSEALLIDALYGLQWDNYNAILLRRRYVDLERSLILKSHELYRGRGEWDGLRKRWRFPHNCFINFGHIQHPKDLENFRSAQYQWIGFDELTHFTEGMYLYMFSRLRTVDKEIKPRIRSASNPGGVGHAWVRRRFWIEDKEHEPNQIYTVKQEVEMPEGKKEVIEYGRAFIPATIYDNPFILKNDRQYLARLMELPDSKRAALLNGRWDSYEGQFFTEWDERIHVCKPFEIPKEWKKWVAFDWGYSPDPCVVLWFTENPKDGTVYCYRELTLKETLDEKVAELILQYSEGENIDTIFYPFDIDKVDPQSGVSILERMDSYWTRNGRRWYLKKSERDRKSGWASVRFLLSLRADGSPRMKVFSSCDGLRRTLPEQVHVEDGANFGEDLDTDGDDHWVDALRYFSATFRTYADMVSRGKREVEGIDIGGAIKMPNGEYRIKKEPRVNQSMNWVLE